MFQFTRDNSDVKHSVLSFDKLLCQKANKSRVEIVEKHIEQHLLRKDEVEEIIGRQQDSSIKSEVEKMGELIRTAIDASIGERCGAIVEEKTTKYDRFVDNFAAFFNNEDI